ncbi:dihydrofolate reductase [Methylophilales bacterium]|nr:dihydrofolate reductase [Methylophilales bacterium]
MMKISIIVAASENLVIGYRNALPWHISEDLKNFKQITINHSVVMGRKTFESIGKPLKERRNIVISRDRTLKIEGVEVVNSLDEAIHRTKNENEIFIIGGEQIYKIAMPIATHMHITKVYNNIKGDAFFPAFDENEWKILTQKDSETNEGLKFSFIEYQKIV